MRQDSFQFGFLKRVTVASIATVLVLAAACTQRVAGSPFAATKSTVATGGRQIPDVTKASERGDPSSPDSGSTGPGADGGDADVGVGPGGAPFDPCRVITWDDLPGEKPAEEAKAQPRPQNAKPEDSFTAACLLSAVHNDIAVMWGPSDRTSVNPSGEHGEKKSRVAGQAALTIVGVSEEQHLLCMVKVDLGHSRGVAAVGAYARSLNQSPDKHPCAVATNLAAQVVKRVVKP